MTRKTELADDIAGRLELYRKGKPFVETPPKREKGA